MKEFKLPPKDLAMYCKDVLNDAPLTIADLETCLGEVKNELSGTRASLIIANKSEKVDIRKAIIDSDDKMQGLKEDEVKYEALLSHWKSAQTNARSFYRAQTNQ